jgi:hypothetical protein
MYLSTLILLEILAGRASFFKWCLYCGFRSSRSRSRRKAIAVTVEADHPVGPTRSGRSDAGLLLV